MDKNIKITKKYITYSGRLFLNIVKQFKIGVSLHAVLN